MNKQKIIIVEDDEIMSLNLNLSLQKYGYTIVAVCDNIMQAKSKINTHKPDLLIIDISLNEISDGIKLGKFIRETHNIPFVYLTSYDDNETISQAKLTEPYGYIIKPFDPNSLHATMQIALFKFEMEQERNNNFNFMQTSKLNLKQLLQEKCTSEKTIIYFAEKYHLDLNAHTIFYDGLKIQLTKKENAFLHLLIAQLGIVVSFEQVVNYVWEDTNASENSVRTLVWRLRNKLKTDIIKNASGVGYYIQE